MEFRNLFKPIRIGKMLLKNRMTAAPMVSNFAGYDGHTNDRLLELYRRKARGGWSLICVEASYVREDGRNFNRMHGIYKDEFIGGLSELAEAIHDGGAKASIQIMHAGKIAVPRWTKRKVITPYLNKEDSIYSSESEEGKISISSLRAGDALPHQLCLDEIEEIIQAFVDAAMRGKEAGFDMITIHGAHEFLIAQFMEKGLNLRDDIYGDPAAFPVQIIKRIRNVLGPDFPISIRISADEFLGQKGITIEDTTKMVPKFVEAGIDHLDVSAGAIATANWLFQPIYYPRGCITFLAEKLKKVVNIPVTCVGRINDPILAENIVREGRADIVSFGRGSVADVDLPRKTLEGRYKEIRKCLACDVCTESISNSRGITCAVNYEYGREQQNKKDTVFKKRNVLIAGGGVAGMEAARVAAEKGHNVILYEKTSSLGGTVKSIAGKFKKIYTRELLNIVEYLEYQMEKLKIAVFLDKNVTTEIVKKIQPDVFINATGAYTKISDIPGVDQPHVFTIDEYMKNEPDIGKNIVIIGGGYGSELAASLAKEKKKVTIIEAGPEIAVTPYFVFTRRGVLLNFIKKLDIDIKTNTIAMKIDKNNITVKKLDKKEIVIDTENVILADERISNSSLVEDLENNRSLQFFNIGDSHQPRNIKWAIHEANVAVGKIE